MGGYEPTKKDLKALKYTLKHIRHLSGNPACCEAVDRVHELVPSELRALHNEAGDWADWLGESLVRAGIIDHPKGEPCDLLFSGDWRLSAGANMQWYWPLELLLWGCREYQKRNAQP